jgi:hypothetical protein
MPYQVTCADKRVRHTGLFVTREEAEAFAEWGHICTRAHEISQLDCTHKPRKKDAEAGYEGCMFCVETGECDGHKGYCAPHGVAWDVWQDRLAERW